MLNKNRYIDEFVRDDLARFKMVFIGGPRQVGKTTYSFELLTGNDTHSGYLNFDDAYAREQILENRIPAANTLVFDEIHKYTHWRSLLKGLYDTRKNSCKIIVTGSARLDYYRKGGDSLLGRYHYYRLHPWSLGEMGGDPANVSELLQYGGFPEPLFASDERIARRWRRERNKRIINEDLRDLEQVRDISKLELLLGHLPLTVGSPLSVNGLRKLLQVAHESVEKWISIFENLYLCFRISPFGAAPIRAVKKERKLYFWDWADVDDPGARFENLVACQLLKYCHFIEDCYGHDMDLRYIRDTDAREVDFVVLKDHKPLFAVECKKSSSTLAKSMHYFKERLGIADFYQVHLNGKEEYIDTPSGIHVLPFAKFCTLRELP